MYSENVWRDSEKKNLCNLRIIIFLEAPWHCDDLPAFLRVLLLLPVRGVFVLVVIFMVAIDVVIAIIISSFVYLFTRKSIYNFQPFYMAFKTHFLQVFYVFVKQFFF